MDAYNIIMNRRSIRQFKRKKAGKKMLERIADAGRLAPSAANMQPLKFLIVDRPEALLEKIFTSLRWAGHLPRWAPEAHEQPAAYIFLLADTSIKKAGYEYDAGLAAGCMVMAATALGFGSCCLGIADRKKMAELLKVPRHCELTLAIALGYAKGNAVVEDMKPAEGTPLQVDGVPLIRPSIPKLGRCKQLSIKPNFGMKDSADIKYYIDEKGIFHVPKRKKEEVITWAQTQQTKIMKK